MSSKVIENPKGQDARMLLVERVAASRYIGRSARLRDLLLYLCKRVLEDSAGQIHEQEVGYNVFGRSADYDTAVDNTVRVHASQLRKRLERYFETEGREEVWVIEIPKGNYAPVFRERCATPVPLPDSPIDVETAEEPPTDWRLWMLAGLALLFAATTLFAYFRPHANEAANTDRFANRPAVKLFWSQVFKPGQQTDIVLDDATVGLYQEMSGRTMGISEYVDRSYLRKLDQKTSSLVMRRQSSYAGSHLLWNLFKAAGPLDNQSNVYFARDYTFRGIKSDNVILLGNSHANPWIEPFEDRLGIRWTFHEELGIYYPEDTLAAPSDPNRYRMPVDPSEGREGYFTAALLPNLGGSGNVLILSGTGGSAVNTGGEFLCDERGIAQLRAKLPASTNGEFPYFEALIRTKTRGSVPMDATVLIARPLRR